jgi:hypothetical protein
MKKIYFLITAIAFLVACEPKVDQYKPDPGNADFTRFVVFGHSLVAGYSNGALYNSGQMNSLPRILDQQLQLAGADSLVQPLVTSELGVLPGKLQLGYTTSCTGVTGLGVVPATGTLEPLGPVGYSVTNLAVPGMKSFHALAPHYGDFSLILQGLANPYYCRFSTNPANAVIDEIAPLDPTFFCLWLGENDALWYAMSGGQTDSITPVPLFGFAMSQIVTALTANGAKGVISTVGDVTTSPFFTTIPYNGLVLTQEQADQINYAMSLFQLPFVYQAGPNPFLINEPLSPHPYFKVRQMVPGELVLLTVPQDSLKCGGWGIISPWALTPKPIPPQFVLTLPQVTQIQGAIDGYNEVIRQLASAHDLAVADMNANLKTLKSGIVWDGVKMSTSFITGGAFSCDGLHLTPRGCALGANWFIDAINAKYGSHIPYANVTAYPGLIFP